MRHHLARLTLHILAAVAEHEREMIAARTKAALQAGSLLAEHTEVETNQIIALAMRRLEALEQTVGEVSKAD